MANAPIPPATLNTTMIAVFFSGSYTCISTGMYSGAQSSSLSRTKIAPAARTGSAKKRTIPRPNSRATRRVDEFYVAYPARFVM